MPASARVQSRFWALVALVAVLSVVATAAAVLLGARPYLEASQQREVAIIAQKTALQVENSLKDTEVLLSFVARQPDVVAVARGLAPASTEITAHFSAVSMPAMLERVALLDRTGAPLADLGFDAEAEWSFAPTARRLLAQTLLAIFPLDARDSIRVPVAYHRSDGTGHVLLGVPIEHGGRLQGLLIAELTLDLARIMPARPAVQSAAVVSEHFPRKFIALHSPGAAAEAPAARAGHPYAISGPGAVAALDPGAVAEVIQSPLRQFALDVAVKPDWRALRNTGRDMVLGVVTATSLALLTPFLLLGWLGRRTLVAPHLKLAAQSRELTELAAVARNANDSILVTDLDERVLWVNPAFERMSGFSAAEVRGLRPGQFLQGPETDPAARARIRAALATRSPVRVEILNYTKSRHSYWTNLSINPLVDHAGQAYGFMAISGDITPEREQSAALLRAKEQIERQSLEDPLTHLRNRRALDLALEERASDPLAGSITLLRIDLDHFKFVNDTLGHAAGDFVLIEVARILSQETRQEDLAARVGGDEFVVLLGPGSGLEEGRDLAERLLARIRKPIDYEGQTAQVGASFGVASTECRLLGAAEVLVGADAALYRAKEKGRSTVEHYSQELNAEVVARRKLAGELRQAIDEAQFVPHYQPQIDVETGALVGVEVLCRWPRRDGVLARPDSFLAAADQLSLTGEIDQIIFRKAVAEIEQINSAVPRVPKLSFNITAQRLQDPRLMEAAHTAARTARVAIAFEILESVLLEEQAAVFDYHLDLLREAGISVQIDDFGSGHASIVGLMHARPDSLKIDKRLVMPVDAEPAARSLLKSIIEIARTLEIDVIAEGVETAEHAEALLELGIRVMQGFHLAAPMSGADFVRYLDRRGAGAAA